MTWLSHHPDDELDRCYWLGGRPQNTFFDGQMDEIRLSDVARSAAEIAATWTLSATCP